MSSEYNKELKLSEREQLLLSRYADGECGFFQSFQAKLLLSRSHDALRYLSNLEKFRSSFSEHLSTQEEPQVDLWERINSRIEQEERAALYLGTRRVESPRNSIWDTLSLPSTWVGGLSGAAIAGAALIFFHKPAEIVSFSAPQQIALQSAPQRVQQVALGSQRQARPRVAPLTQQPSFEVDWMRSHGSLNLIPDSGGASAIIWVRRRQPPSLQSKAQTSPLQPRALLTASPVRQPSRVSGPLDESTINGAK
jgi:hypothetical protein